MLTRKEIDNYHVTTDQELKHEIEKTSLNSTFESDALDGYSELNTNTSDLRGLDKKFLRTSAWSWMIALTSVVLLTASLFVIGYNRKNLPEKTPQSNNTQIDKIDVFIPARIDTLTVLPKEELISAKVLIKNFKARKSFEKEIVHTSNTEDPRVENLPILPLSSQTETKGPISFQIQGAEFYLHNLKLLDYRKYRSKNHIPTEEVFLNGTSADLEDANSFREEDWESREIPYVNYLEKTMSYFSKGQYKRTLNRLEHILQTYPDDLNALFYAGLIQYNLDNAEQAFQLFKQCTEHKYSNFNEEALWYCALSRIRQKEKAQAIQILEKIEAEKGFYANQAKKLLSEIR
jgi:hypothetical protein